MSRAFIEREAGPVACDAACIHCGDPADCYGLCDACAAVVDIAGEHERACDCGACRVFAKIDARRAAVSL